MKNLILVATFFALSNFTQAQEIIKPGIKAKTSFAIIVDQQTFNAAQNEIIAYQKSIENDGLAAFVIHDNWKNPQEIKDILQNMYQDKKQPLEGAVFIGDIPIPMIREAQPLTSALKIPEKIKWENSSVASDRFYDDFDLKFDYLKQDSVASRNLYHYYKLAAKSPHYIEMDIYTGRIKPPVNPDSESAIDQIKSYLNKIVQLKAESNTLDKMIVSTGHGYNSNSTVSWGNELLAMRSTFPKLFAQGSSIKFLNYRNSSFLKNALLTELQREDLDLAFMTGHGTVTLQLMNGYPDVSSPQPSMENVGRYIRSKMRNAKGSNRDLDKVKSDFQNSLGLNDKWFEDAFDEARLEADSLFNEELDIQMYDLKQVNARVAYLNSCLTGSFHKDDYLAGYYPFSNGKNVVAFANTVGVLQDLWGMQLLGILQNGARVGHLLKKTAFLETHILGDPTFHFSSEKNYNDLFVNQKATKKDWYKLLKEKDADLQSYALTELSKIENEKGFSEKLVELFKTSPFESVRTQAYFQLRKYNNQAFLYVLDLALNDNYEYIKRIALYDVSDMGDVKFIDQLIDIYIKDQELARSQYRISWMFQFFDYDAVTEALNRKLKGNENIFNSANLLEKALTKVSYAKTKNADLLKVLSDTNSSEKELNSQIRMLRLYRHHSAVPQVISIIKDDSKSMDTRISALEALSWFGQSYQKDLILKMCNDLITTSTDDVIVQQAQKTKQIITDATKRQW